MGFSVICNEGALARYEIVTVPVLKQSVFSFFIVYWKVYVLSPSSPVTCVTGRLGLTIFISSSDPSGPSISSHSTVSFM